MLYPSLIQQTQGWCPWCGEHMGCAKGEIDEDAFRRMMDELEM